MTITRVFSGISDPTNYPPQNALAVSLNYIVTSESSKIEWTNPTGGQAVNESLYTLFGSLPASQRNSLLDVRVAFDSVNQRFVIMAENLGSNASNIDIAVSKDANPNDGWWVGSVSSLLSINGSTTYADMPYLSVDGSNIYVSEAQYGSGLAGTQEWVFSDSIYNGGSVATVATQVAPAAQGIVRNVSGANGLTYYVSAVPSGGQSVLTLQTYNAATNSFNTATTLQLHNTDQGPGSSDYTIAQMGTSLLLDAYDSRIASLAYANGYLYGLSEVKPSGSSVPEIHWFKIDVATNPNAPTVVAQGDITGSAIGAGVGVFNASLAVDAAGDLIVNFTASSANMYPADYYIYELAGGSTFSAPLLYQASTGFFNSGASGAQRWGTYSTSVADPGNANGFWVSNEYVANNWWQTSIAQIAIPGVQGVLAGTTSLNAATEGTALATGTTLASFTDSNSADTASVFTASLTWGDGSTSAGTVSGSNGSFSVTGGHTYAEEGSYVLAVAITDTADNARITPTGTIAVADADVLTAHAVALNGAVGQALNNVTVATFSDTDTSTPASGLTATIAWGDGSTSAGTVSGSNGSFAVSGSHTYSASGTEPVTVTLSDIAPGTAAATANSSAQITAPGVLAGTTSLTAATEGTALATGTTLASFTDSNSADTASVFTASLTWGDGSTSAGTVSGSNGSFSVTGGHTYAEEGSYVLAVALTDTADNARITPTGTIAVADADVLTAHAVTLNGAVGQALNNVTVATFSDTDTSTPASGLTATIAWGDGSTSAGTVSGSNGSFAVSGSHTYSASGTEPVTVTLSDIAPGTAAATANSSAQITAAAGLVITTATTGPISLSSSPYALTVTTTGSIKSTGGSTDGVEGSSTNPSTVANAGVINATGTRNSAGVRLPAGGSVTNSAGASIAGAFAIDVTGGSATVINNGTITGSRFAVYFSGGGTRRLVVGPTAVFNGKVSGGSGSNTLELSGGQGSIAGLLNNAGTVTENGSWAFTGFHTIAVDSGGTWLLNGGKVATLANNGTIDVKGSLDVSSAIDPTSTGLFLLNSTATLEVAAALGSATQIRFMAPSTLKVDTAIAFGTNVGGPSYTGPLLEMFGAGGTIDLLNFTNSGVVLNYSSTTGVLQLTNGASKAADFRFDPATLGAGTFHTATDGSTGILITRS